MTDDNIEQMVNDAHQDERVTASRCDDGHEWAADYTSGDTCCCGALYLIRNPDGCMKVTER